LYRVEVRAAQHSASSGECGLMSDYVGLGLIEMAGETLADARTGRNGRHALVGLLRQSVFGRLAGYEDVNDAERLRHDPTMRWIVGGTAAHSNAASSSQMGPLRNSVARGTRARAAGSHPHLASVLQQSRKSANIHVSLGGIRGIPVEARAAEFFARASDKCHRRPATAAVMTRRQHG
jgi:Transposase DDE domain group 1